MRLSGIVWLLISIQYISANATVTVYESVSTCAELWLKYNIHKSGTYTILLPNADGDENSPITVECNMDGVWKDEFQCLNLPTSAKETAYSDGHVEVLTIVHHNSEDIRTVQGYESPGSYVRNIRYNDGKTSVKQIEKIINSSFSCQQYIRWECRGSAFNFWQPKNFHSWWMDRSGEPQMYWGNAEPYSNSCGCFPYCHVTTKNSTCNCDANLKSEWLEDSGLLLATKHIPVTQLRFGDTGESYETGKHRLGPLVCRSSGHRHFFMGNFTAPATIYSPGYPHKYPPAFRHYEWRVLVGDNQPIELVFPEYDVIHHGAYNTVPGCRFTLEVDIYQQPEDNGEIDFDPNHWNWIKSIKREKATPPYYVTDGRRTLFVMRFITCNQVLSAKIPNKGFRAEFRDSKCKACNLESEESQIDCLVKANQCVYIYSTGYPFPHYLYENIGQTLLNHWNLITVESNVLQIELNDFDVISTPGQHYCDADLLMINRRKYCNINRFDIGKLHTKSNRTELIFNSRLKRVGNSRGIHATIHSVPATARNLIKKYTENAAEGKPTDQSSTREFRDSSLAVDGIREQRDPLKCSSTNYEREPWWRVNLQKRHRIRGVKIFSQTRKQEPLHSTKFYENMFDEKLPDGAQWPDGQYALPMPVSGCPDDSTWKTGMRFHAIQHEKVYYDKTQYWSEGIMLKGGATGSGIEQHFCIHTSSTSNNNTWMPGKYCIFQYGHSCPEGFHNGALTWFDKKSAENSSFENKNSQSGSVPRGVYTTHNTTIYFCCREDGKAELPIRLPKTRPFYLFQYGQTCQEVEGMSEVEHFFHYEEAMVMAGSSVELIFTSGQQLKFQDPHPRVDATLFDKGFTLHYCYYDIADKLKGFQVLVDTTPDIIGYGRNYDEVSGISWPVHKPFLSAVECASYSVTADEFDVIELNCTQPVEGQYVIIFMNDRQDSLQLCEVMVFGDESCGRPLGMATEEILDSAITASSFDRNRSLLYHPYNVRLNSPKAWCAQSNDPEKYIQIDLRLQNSNIVFDSKVPPENDANWNNINYVTIVGLAMQGLQMSFKSYFVTQFQLMFSNDSIHWAYEEEPIGKQKIYKCSQCEAQNLDGTEIVMYNLLKPIVTRFIRIKIISSRFGPCMRLELIGCRGDKRNFCSRTLTAATPGVISSPNYPFYYAQYKSCFWKIKPSKRDKHIELDFIVLDLAPVEKSGGKCHDQLLIRSMGQPTIVIEAGLGFSRKLNQHKQLQYPKKIVSNGPISVNLRTCFRFTMSRYQGFLLRFKEADCPGCGVGDSRCSRIHNCTSLCGTIMSINHPLNYIDNHRCQWLIRAPPGHYFNVTIEDFDVVVPFDLKGRPKRSTSNGCIYDHLTFTDPSTGIILGRYCNSHKPPKHILSNWNELLIEFSTDSSYNGRGFRLKYQAQRYQLLPEVIPLLRSPPNACPNEWMYFRGYCYAAFVESDSLQWYQAEDKCSQKLKGRDGHLVSITDYLEMNVVHYWIIEEWKLEPHQSIYIGLIDTNREGFYNWSDGNPMSYTDWYRADSFTLQSENESRNWSWTMLNEPLENVDQLHNFNGLFNKYSQPDGGAFEDCTVINFYSIHSTANWHDIPCSLGKKVLPKRFNSSSIGGEESSMNATRRSVSDGLIRSYICKMDSNSSTHQHSPRIPLFRGVISENEIRTLEAKVDQNRYFVCDNKEVISYLFRCDGFPNCRDGTDENDTDCSPCLESQFKCDNGHCIAIGKYCDFVDDCGDGSDEISCVRRQCKKNFEFRCNNDQCIPITKRCDLIPDCRDQSDEGVSCSGGKCNLNTTFQCYFGSCIPLYTLCDKHRDCPGKFYEDEHESVCYTLFNDDQLSTDYGSDPGKLNRFYRWRRDAPAINNPELDKFSSHMSRQLNQLEKSQKNHRKQRNTCSTFRNTRRTCQDLLDNFNITTDGFKELQPIYNSQITMTVYCHFINSTHATTVINHDTEDRLYVRSSVIGPGSYYRMITYEASLDLINSVIDYSAHCRQLLSYECSGSGFYFNSSKPLSWWYSRNMTQQFTWGGGVENACACYPNCTPSNLRCNCDSNIKFNWTRDFGYVEDRAKLPIRQIAFGDVYGIGQLGFLQVGPIECTGNANTLPPEDCHELTLSKRRFQCNSQQIIDSKYECIYEFDQLGYQIGCRDVSHLRNCSKFQCPSDYVKCPNSYCIPHRYICNGKWDCVGGSDEIGCAKYICPGKYKCANESSCILLHQLCDGSRHCPLGDDEWYCNLTCPQACTCIGLFIDCRNSNFNPQMIKDIPKETKKLDLSGNNFGSDMSMIDFSIFSDLGELILQNIQLEIVRTRKFIQLTNLYKLDLRNNRIKVIEQAAFAGLGQVTTLLLDNNPELSQIQSGAFVGLVSLRKLNISNTQLNRIEKNLFLQMSSLQTLTLSKNRIETVENGGLNDLNSLVSLDMRGNPIHSFPKDMFNMLKSLRYLSTDSFKFCCLVSGIVPFERCFPPQDEISDCEDLMSNTVQRLILWVLGIIAFFGNIVVVVWRYRTRTHTNQVSSLLILSLGCSDFLMGIYLLIIASVDEYYRGRYIENSDYWKHSALCKFCGFLSTISSEMSVLTLVIITIDRLISISFSFSNFRFTVSFTHKLLSLSWLTVLLVSILPLLPIDYFKGQFYSRSGVCLALHITTCRSPGWEYSVAIFLFFNLVAFLFILFCYCFMYNTISVSARKLKNMRAKQVRETKIGRQMALIVISNFLCWFPVIIMGFLALAGITIPGAAYSWTAVVVLPLNSATNPVIYTLLAFIPNMLDARKNNEQNLAKSGHSLRTRPTGSSSKARLNESRYSAASQRQLVDYRPASLLLRPPPGYQTLTEFIRMKDPLTTRDLLEICHSLSENICEFHQVGYALGTMNFDNIFVTCSAIPINGNQNRGDSTAESSSPNRNRLDSTMETIPSDSQAVDSQSGDSGTQSPERISYQLQTYIPGFSAYRVNESRDADDYAVDMKEFGLVVKRMLQLYHARLMKTSNYSVNR